MNPKVIYVIIASYVGQTSEEKHHPNKRSCLNFQLQEWKKIIDKVDQEKFQIKIIVVEPRPTLGTSKNMYEQYYNDKQKLVCEIFGADTLAYIPLNSDNNHFSYDQWLQELERVSKLLLSRNEEAYFILTEDDYFVSSQLTDSEQLEELINVYDEKCAGGLLCTMVSQVPEPHAAISTSLLSTSTMKNLYDYYEKKSLTEIFYSLAEKNIAK